MIKIVDYGMGNLRSVQKAFEKIGAEAVIVSHPAEAEGHFQNSCCPAWRPFSRCHS